MSKRRIGIQILLASAVCGGTFGLVGCASALGRSFNPCGTVLACDPVEFDVLMLNDPTQPNWDYNPTCVLPALGIDCGSTDTTTTSTTNQTTANTTTTST